MSALDSIIKHGGDCGGTWCDFCGCCMHGDDGKGCRAAEAPIGMDCPGSGCACGGECYYDAPVMPPEAPDEAALDPSSVQLHQETSLDLGEWSVA